MNTLKALIKRNTKLFFKDKGMFFTSLITPLILLVLYGTFLSNVYKETFLDSMKAAEATVKDTLINGFVGGQLVSSLLAVSCITVAFCSNMVMVQDKVNGAKRDLTISPVGNSTIALSYYISTLFSTLLVCLIAAGVCLLYLAKVGWYLPTIDVLLLLFDVLLLSLFGTAMSSIVNHFLSTQGQMSAVGAIISAGYGFICGAYMPISQFSKGIQNVVSFLPGTYGTSLLRNHVMRGTFEEMNDQGFPTEVVETLKDSVDYNLYFFENKVETTVMYLILLGSVILMIAVYVLMNVLQKKQK